MTRTLNHQPAQQGTGISAGVVPHALTLTRQAQSQVRTALPQARAYLEVQVTPLLHQHAPTGRLHHTLTDCSEAFIRAVVAVLTDAGYAVKEEHTEPGVTHLTLTWSTHD